jgi:hypothetical protein
MDNEADSVAEQTDFDNGVRLRRAAYFDMATSDLLDEWMDLTEELIERGVQLWAAYQPKLFS